eukprot:1603636-Pyramimonas_sp.AAC.1
MYGSEAQNLATVSQMEGGSFSKRGSRLSAAHIRFNNVEKIHRLKAGGFQNVVLALARRTFV